MLVLAHAALRPRTDDWLDETLRQVTREEVGCVGGKVLDPNGAIAEFGLVIDPQLGPCPAHAGSPADRFGYFGRTTMVHNVSAVGRAFLAVRFAAWQRQGGLSRAATPALEDALFAGGLSASAKQHVVLPQLVLEAEATTSSAVEACVTADQVPQLATQSAPWSALVPDAHHSPHLTAAPCSHAYRTASD